MGWVFICAVFPKLFFYCEFVCMYVFLFEWRAAQRCVPTWMTHLLPSRYHRCWGGWLTEGRFPPCNVKRWDILTNVPVGTQLATAANNLGVLGVSLALHHQNANPPISWGLPDSLFGSISSVAQCLKRLEEESNQISCYLPLVQLQRSGAGT